MALDLAKFWELVRKKQQRWSAVGVPRRRQLLDASGGTKRRPFAVVSERRPKELLHGRGGAQLPGHAAAAEAGRADFWVGWRPCGARACTQAGTRRTTAAALCIRTNRQGMYEVLLCSPATCNQELA